MTMGLKQAQKQTLGAMKTHAPPPQRPTPAGSAPVGNATPAFGYGAPGAAAAPRTDVNMFAPPPSAPMGGLQPGGAAGFANAVAGGLDDLLGGMNLGARQNTSGSNAMGCVSSLSPAGVLVLLAGLVSDLNCHVPVVLRVDCTHLPSPAAIYRALCRMAQQQPAAQKGLDALDSFFGARPAAAAPPMQAADPFAAVATPAAAAAAAPAPAAGGIDAFDDFFAGSRPAAAPTPSKPTPVISPPQAAAPVSPAKPAGGDDFDLFARGGEAPPAQPQPSVAPPTQVGSPPPAAAPEDFDFFAGGAPAAAPATPANHQPSFDSLDALGSIGGSAVKKGASVDPLDNIMGWGAAPAQTQPQTVVAPRAQGAQPDLFGTHVSAAQVAVRQPIPSPPPSRPGRVSLSRRPAPPWSPFQPPLSPPSPPLPGRASRHRWRPLRRRRHGCRPERA